MWSSESSEDSLSCNSRTGFVISYAGCPILWKSKIQPLIALSTAEAEYIALSSALREVIAIIHLMDDLKNMDYLSTVQLQSSSVALSKIT